MAERQFIQASLAYESVGLYEKAILATKDAMDTDRLLSLLKHTQVYDIKQTEDLLNEYVIHLKDQSRYAECGKIYKRLKQPKEAVYHFCKAEDWK